MSRIGRLPVVIPDGVTVEVKENNYVVTTSFRDAETDGSIVAPEPGKIYQFAYAFKQNNIREEWDADKMVVYVKVTTVDWQIETVYPNF